MKTETLKRDEATEEWRRLHNEELNDLYFSYNIFRVIISRMRWAGHIACKWEGRGAYTVLVGKAEGKRPFGRSRRRWEDDIKMNLQEVGCRGMDWIELAQDRDRTSCKPVSFSGRTLLHKVSM
jgi:3-oxoacyl-ACP reductase-like protein